MNILIDYFLYFISYSFLGWLWECSISLVRDHKIVNRGFLNGPYCPIYGCGAILCILLNNFFQNPFLLFFVGGISACALEYATSYAMEKIFKARWWDYSDYKFNLNGRICLLGFIIFGLAAAGSSFLQPVLQTFIQHFEHRQYIACGIAIIFATDIFSTNNSFARFNKILRDYQAILKKGRIAQFIDRHGKKILIKISDEQRKIFTYQQRRLMRAFPNFKSNYDRAYNDIIKFYQRTKYQPKQSAHARQKSKKILK